MSVLIDELFKEERIFTHIDSKWYVAKPVPFYSMKTLFNRIKDAVRVLRGKSFAFHYKEDTH